VAIERLTCTESRGEGGEVIPCVQWAVSDNRNFAADLPSLGSCRAGVGVVAGSSNWWLLSLYTRLAFVTCNTGCGNSEDGSLELRMFWRIILTAGGCIAEAVAVGSSGSGGDLLVVGCGGRW